MSDRITKMRDMFHRTRLVIDKYLMTITNTMFHKHSDILQKHNGAYDWSYVWTCDGEVCELNVKLWPGEKQIIVFTCLPEFGIEKTKIRVFQDVIDRAKLNDLYPKFFENLIEELQHELFELKEESS